VTPALFRYVEFEQFLMRLDDLNDPSADAIRDMMDPMWFDLTDHERSFLNSRGHLAAPLTVFTGGTSPEAALPLRVARFSAPKGSNRWNVSPKAVAKTRHFALAEGSRFDLKNRAAG
jgi:hypothetical protein